ncbi:uncharacterized protein LOC112094497 isoform X2 [Morus notabilis]|uniref:uncharacterized protein LOC112094497 isoform X2 n=1 Tax=Morus notabilis TaxID=981085 RepID=UPI000CED2252|nr:uncharacterized protein LOC112094497 isoform X2 [Morus notabilis]
MAASSPPPPTPADTIHGGTDDSRAGSSSFFRKTVCLFDWWLIKTESAFQGKRLGIAGFTSREQNRALRAFSSSAITKRFDVFTLETSDGVSIVIKGFINKQRTTDNGFPSEVFNDFIFGFPPNWQKYAIHEDSNKLNPGRVLGGTIQSGRKLDVSEKSPIHLLAKIRSQTKDRPTVVLGLASRYNTLNPLPVVSYPKNNLVQNEVGGGSILIASGNELQEPMDANVAQKLGDGSVKDGPHQTSKSKQGRKPKNVNSKAAKETDTEEETNTEEETYTEEEFDTKEESTPLKKTKRKIMFEKQVPPHSPEEKAITSIFSPECSTVRQSRSGRLLLPTMEFWRNQMPVYDSERNLTGILGDLPDCIAKRKEIRKKQKKEYKKYSRSNSISSWSGDEDSS